MIVMLLVLMLVRMLVVLIVIMEGTSETTSHKQVLPILQHAHVSCTHNGTHKLTQHG
ncbi:hypothetical protein PFNF54_00153 [Plasmodium falciparum NF54]|uniref:Secreted protein n=1 Tax=Plasmodium falciparum (isolate NF54) TaxID=5843 RepID=W7K2B0_PLAFO|nr:hypothetical protein PFNF54_00153 [Plasmodium falciparum NF54]